MATPSPAASTVTLSHKDFEDLLKMAQQGDSTQPSAFIATAGTSVSDHVLNHSWLI